MFTDALLAHLHESLGARGLREFMAKWGSYLPVLAKGLQSRDTTPTSLEKDMGLPSGIVDMSRIKQLETGFAARGITVISSLDPEYPNWLANLPNPPQMLYVQGNHRRLRHLGFGICGSREASPKGLSFARKFGSIVAELGVAEVSGYARGVDTEAHLGALEVGGETIVVLAEGILNFRLKSSMRGLENLASRMTVLSEFPPTRPWSVYNAMQRNKTTCALSMAMVVVEARETGGTLDAGKECLRQNKPLLVINYHDATEMPKGNRMLLRSGGTPINTPRQLREYLQKVRLKQPQLSSVVQAQMPMLA